MTSPKLRKSLVITAAAVVVAVVSLLSACSSSTEASSNSSDGILVKAKTGKLIIGVKADQPGLSLLTPDGYEGYDINIAKIIAGGLGVPPEGIEWKTTVSINREPFIETGVVDLVVATYTINDARKKVVAFAGPYYTAGQDLLVRADSTITGPKDMDGEIACSVTGSSSALRMEKEFPDVQLQLFDSYSKCVTALSGGVDAATTDSIILAGYAAQPQNVGKFKLTGHEFSQEPYGIGLAKQDVAGCRRINEILVESAADGSYNAAFVEALGPSGLKAPTLDPAQLTNCPTP